MLVRISVLLKKTLKLLHTKLDLFEIAINLIHTINSRLKVDEHVLEVGKSR